jgi:hypothetical protein
LRLHRHPTFYRHIIFSYVGIKNVKNCTLISLSRWDSSNSEVIDFDPPSQQLAPEDDILVRTYQPPQPQKFRVSQNVLDPQLTKHNYRGRLHELLYIEEMAQFEQVCT